MVQLLYCIGDGIGPEISAAVQKIFNVAQVILELLIFILFYIFLIEGCCIFRSL